MGKLWSGVEWSIEREEEYNERIGEKLFVCEREWKVKWELEKLKVQKLGKKMEKYQENWNCRKFGKLELRKFEKYERSIVRGRQM